MAPEPSDRRRHTTPGRSDGAPADVATPGTDEHDSEEVAVVLGEVARLLGAVPGDGDGPPPRPRDPDAVAAFCRAALRRVAPGELALAEVGPVARQLVHAFDLLGDRPPRQASVEVRPGVASWFGPEGGRTVVEVVASDRPLLFSTVMAALRAAGVTVRRYSHPIVGVRRGPDGEVVEVAPPPAGTAEVLIHVEVAEELEAALAAALGAELVEAIGDAVLADRDGPAMRSVLAVAADRLIGDVALPPGAAGSGYDARARAEVAGFCRWLLSRNFLFVGLERSADGTRLGVCAAEADDHGTDAGAAGSGADVEQVSDEPLAIRRSTTTSRVSRRERLAEVLVADVDDRGRLQGTIRALGLTTLRGRSERPSGVPWLRRTLRAALRAESVVPGSHDETVLTSLFDDLPWDVLLMADVAWMRRALSRLLVARQRGRPDVLVLPEPGGRALTALVAHPADHERPGLREDVERHLRERFGPESLEVQQELGSSGMSMLTVVVALPPDREVDVDPAEVEADLARLSRSWADRLTDALTARLGRGGRTLAARWLPRLPAAYRAGVEPAEAADDVADLDRIEGTGDLVVRVRERGFGDGEVGPGVPLEVRLVVDGPPLELSRLVPVLEATGLRVGEDMTFPLPGERPASVLQLRVVAPELTPGDARRLAETVRACWTGRAEVDRLNSLVLVADLEWEQVAVLRAYARYLAQLRPGTGPDPIEEALADNPDAARALWERIEARFGPAEDGTPRDADWDEAGRAAVLTCCDRADRLDQDRILRDLSALVDATVRTNVFAEVRSGSVTIALDGSRLPVSGRSRTWRELWVSSPEVEGLHLRAGPVARGGLRWSDRSGDLRTEVLQLMSAQELKNALIVPTGAKGGFVLRHRPSDPAELRAAVRSAYSTFVASLLDVVDDLVDGRTVRPAGVRAADDDDSYLVVAADRGTATFSDLANRFAQERGFWLGDAFASGGSAGYDHKALGVTARGAWVSVAEHFARLGTDVARDPFTVAGVGDMSGDVFGNGVLLSPELRLVAAFDHRHVFLDPDPDPAASLAERRRLFGLPRSSWADYDPDVLSPGGMVVPRTAKRAELSDEARAALGIEEHEPSLPELVRAVLRAPVDLLYFGGIGTFLRAGSERDAEVGDAANDEIRVAAGEVRARVVVEGANLAVTPAARSELAGRDVQLNSDAVDNSAGVDCSDHEVNLKVLLGLAEADGRLDRAGRDRHLAEVADEVVAATLSNVAHQNRALTRAEVGSRDALEPYLSLLFALEGDGRVDRGLHGLPSGGEVRRRRESREGLRRPELAVMMAAAKEALAELALASDLPDREPLHPLAAAALPATTVARFGDLVGRHPLHRPMVASRLANEVVDRMGMTWAWERARRSGADPTTVLAAYWMARCTARLGAWWEAVDRADPDGRDRTWDPAVEVVDALAGDYLRRGVASSWRWEEVERSAEAADVLCPDGPGTADVRSLRRLTLATALADVAHRADRHASEVLGPFLDAGERFGIDRIAWALLGHRVPPEDGWAQRHRDSLLFDVDRLRRAAALALLDPRVERRSTSMLAGWTERLDETLGAGGDRLDPLAVAVAELWLLVEDLAGRIPRS